MAKKSSAICLFLSFLPGFLNLHAQQNEDTLIFPQFSDTVLLLDEVIVEAFQVSGKLRTIPGSMSVLTGEGLNAGDGTNLDGSLNTLPGITMQTGTYATSRIVIRGMGSRTPYNTNRIRAYLNDIPITGSDGISTPEEIDLLSLGRMEVIKGPASALYGSGLGGIINLYSPSTANNRGRLRAQYGSFDTRKAHFSGSLQGEKRHLWGSVSHLHSDGYRENNHYRRTSLLSTAQWKRQGWSVKSTLLLTSVNAGIPSSLGESQFESNPQAASPNWKAIEGYQQNFKSLAGITLTGSLKESITNRLTLFGRWDDNYEKRPFNNLDDQSFSAGFRNRLNYHRENTEWVLGAEYIVEQYKWKLEQARIRLNENRENRNQFGIYAMLYYRPARKLNISMAGAFNFNRYKLTDLYAINGDQSGRHSFPMVISPRIGINYAPCDRFALYTSAGHGYSLPSPEETLLPEGEVNRDIKPEQGWQFETGTRINLFDNTFRMDGAFYWIELSNLLVTKRLTEDIFTGINAGKTRHMGIELLMHNDFFRYPAFPGKLRSFLSYSRSLNRFMDFTDDSLVFDGNHLPGIPRHSAWMQLDWEPFCLLDIMASLQYSGKQYMTDDNTMIYPGHWLINLKMNLNLRLKKTGTLAFFAGLNNLADTRYASMLVINARGFEGSEPRYYYPGMPRHGFAGIQYLF